MDRLWTPWRYAYVTGGDKHTRRRGVPEALEAWPGDHGCVFCNQLSAVQWAVEHGMPQQAADHAAWILARGTACYVVLNAFPYNGGHLMIVPFHHEASLAALPSSTTHEMMDWAQTAERALREIYHPDGLNMGLNLGESAGAGVAHHLHLHAVPRWTGDTNFMTVVGETRVLPEMLEDSWTRLRAALARTTVHA